MPQCILTHIYATKAHVLLPFYTQQLKSVEARTYENADVRPSGVKEEESALLPYYRVQIVQMKPFRNN
jgi:hypothetical protein